MPVAVGGVVASPSRWTLWRFNHSHIGGCRTGGDRLRRRDSRGAAGSGLKGVEAVIDKDFASCKMAELLDADCLIILTAVEKVAIYYGKPNQGGWIP